jgi:hypothetical protein
MVEKSTKIFRSLYWTKSAIWRYNNCQSFRLTTCTQCVPIFKTVKYDLCCKPCDASNAIDNLGYIKKHGKKSKFNKKYVQQLSAILKINVYANLYIIWRH